jgi:hypothetical protein
MNSETMEILLDMKKQIEFLTTEIVELHNIIEKEFNVNIESNWISFNQIASMVGISYTAVYKKVHNRIHPDFIRKVDGLLSIPKRLLKELDYEN